MSKTTYQLDVAGETKELAIHKAFCIGYTGRNKENTYAHIKELAEIGIPEQKKCNALPSQWQHHLSESSNGSGW